MIRRLLSVAVVAVCTLCTWAQMPQLTPLPLNEKVKHGVLPNGLNYYIMHNEEPKERANFYIAQKVGSTLEEKDQLGLAHFLEHMAFNGLEHFPGKSMLNYLQGKGIRFGADINAYTYFDETVYNIDNVPTTDQNLMDSVLLVLHDWSCGILLEDSEINAERGVIQEEWRQRNDANLRMMTAIMPQIYEEYQYQQMVIGSMDVVMNFKPEVLRAYYKKWYRPDQQGIVIVGDFDADKMEAKVKELFSTISMPENAAPRLYPHVSDNKEPVYASYSDPELQAPRTTISFKSEKVPFELRNTVEIYIGNDLTQNIISQLINNRLSENAQNPDCKYAAAGVYFGDFYVSKTKDSFNIVTIPKGETLPAVQEVMAIVMRAIKTGFNDSEIDRVKTNLLASYEAAYNERNKTSNSAYGKELYRFFIDNKPAPGIEKEYELVKQVMPMFTSQMIDQILPQIITGDNMVIVTAEPEKEGFKIVGRDVLVKAVNDAIAAQYEAYVDEVITDPLIAQLPAPGKVKAVKDINGFGAKTYTLSNGVKVTVKPTDFSDDEIMLAAWRKGGKQEFTPGRAANVVLLDDAVDVSKIGPFDRKTLKKYMTGKRASLMFKTERAENTIVGSSVVKDLPTLMELIYASFTSLGEDQDAYKVFLQNEQMALDNLKNNPNFKFQSEQLKTLYGDNPLMNSETLQTLEEANYPEMVKMAKQILSNAAEWEFVMVGNIDENVLIPLMEQYIATLPAAKVTEKKPATNIEVVKGDVKNYFTTAMQTPGTTVFDIYMDTNIPFSVKNQVMVEMVGDLLDIIYTNTLREEEGGTYGANVGANLNPETGKWQLIYAFQTNKEQQDQLINRAQAEFLKLLNDGADSVEFNKVKEAMIKQFEIAERKNGYWMGALTTLNKGFDVTTDYLKTLNSITIEDLNKFMKTLYNGKNRIQIIMEGVQG